MKINLRIRGRLIAGFAGVCIVLAATVGYTVYVVGGVSEVVTRLVNLRAPVAVASTGLTSDVHATLAALRGYLLTGTSEAKAAKASAWKGLDETAAAFDKMAAHFTIPENKRKWAEAKALVQEFRAAQDRAEAIAFTPEAYPATKVLHEAAPRADTIFGEITKMINEEVGLDATPERKQLLKAMADVRGNFAAATAQLRMYLLTGDAADKSRFTQPWKNFENAMEAIKSRKQLLTPSQNAAFEAITKTFAEFAPLPSKMFSIRETAQWNMPVYILTTEAAPRAGKILDLLEGPRGANGVRAGGLKGNQQELLRAESEAALGNISFLINAEWMLLLIGLAAGAVIALFTARSIANPVQGMTGAMTKLAAGDLKAEVPAVGNKDEIGEMAKAVLVFRDAAHDKIRMEREAEEERVRSEAARKRAEEEAIGRERALVSTSIGAGMAKLAAKDLTFRLTDDLPDAYRKLQADFNAAMGQLEQALQGVVSSTQAMNSGTQEISTASSDLSRRTEQQASSLEETAAALDEITATVKKAAEGATHARKVVADTKDDAEKSGQVVRKAVDAMGGIEKSSQQIGQIISVIDEIAFQTNLLALNAGVEAARAGDAGRGFAVVASEVRALAQRSAEAAKEIKELISTSTAQVGEGVELVAETGKSLERIMAKVTDINTVVSDIAAGAQEQATGLQQVNIAVNEMDKVTQQNAAMAEEATAAGRSLTQEAEQLSSLVGQFRLGNVTEFQLARRPQAASPPAPKAEAEAQATKRQLKVPAGRNGSALRKPEPAPAEESWQDF
jgi:methyl-accepting chemotaxis protein